MINKISVCKKNCVSFEVRSLFLFHDPHHVFFSTEIFYPNESIIFSCIFYHELFQFFANLAENFLKDYNTA